jgi:hypothetical protein
LQIQYSQIASAELFLIFPVQEKRLYDIAFMIFYFTIMYKPYFLYTEISTLSRAFWI